MWDPELYQRFGDERSRPFFDLVGRVAAEAPAVVVDLGCGPGTLTATLARRWPGAQVRGIDSSAEMIEAARALPAGGQRLSFALGDVRDWEPGRPRGCDRLQRRAAVDPRPPRRAGPVGGLPPAGRLAGVPGSRQLRPAEPPGAAGAGRLRPLAPAAGRRPVQPPGRGPGASTWTCWPGRASRSTRGRRPTCTCCTATIAVLDWYRGTGLRPVIAALPPGQADEFLADYRARMNEAYPAAPYGTVFPFRRVFVVAVRR